MDRQRVHALQDQVELDKSAMCQGVQSRAMCRKEKLAVIVLVVFVIILVILVVAFLITSGSGYVGEYDDGVPLKLETQKLRLDFPNGTKKSEISYIEVKQTASNDTKPVVLLLHGTPYNADTWNRIGTLRKLKEWGYRAVAVTMNYFWGQEASLETIVDKLDLNWMVIVSPGYSGTESVAYVTEPDNQETIAGYVIIGISKGKYKSYWNMKFPTLRVRGDRYTDTTHIPNSTEMIIPDAGFACYLDQPAKWHEILHDFLSSL